MTTLQRDAARKVIAAWVNERRFYRATRSGERVTLASLYRAGLLARRARRGNDGEPDAAYEYRPSEELMTKLVVRGRVI